jgi:hypothetical protein
MTDFFECHSGNARDYMRWRWLARILDGIHDLRLAAGLRRKRVYRSDLANPRERILVVGVSVPSRPEALKDITARLARSRHQVDVSTVPMLPKGKFENVDDAIRAAPRPLAAYDWLVVTDDDVDIDAGYLDRYLALARTAGLSISQPAHKFHSHTTYQLTRRRWGALARQTGFVEIGPFTVFRSDTFDRVVPFPPSRWAYGIDVLWAGLAERHGWKIGIVDGAPVDHLRPVAGTYDMTAAIEEGKRMLRGHGVQLNRAELLRDVARLL